jgi:hypothetical protein
MRKQDIEITISPTGEVTFQVKGVKGSSCITETQFLEEALGGAVLDRERTSEYYEQADGEGNRAYISEGEDSDS